MSQEQVIHREAQQNIWTRGLFMLLMALAYQVVGALVFVVSVVQFIVRLAGDAPNARLLKFGRGLGRYMQQIVNYLTFVSDEVPFPFSDWPGADG